MVTVYYANNSEIALTILGPLNSFKDIFVKRVVHGGGWEASAVEELKLRIRRCDRNKLRNRTRHVNSKLCGADSVT